MIPWTMAVPGATGVAAAIAAWGMVSPSSQLFGPTLHCTPRPSAIALTFDDGPNPAVTPQLLALLDQHGVRATFFLVGRFARTSPDLVREIAVRNHVIGNHTETHPNLTLLSPRRIIDELQCCQDSIASALAPHVGYGPAWMRPPFGFRGPQLAAAVRRTGLRGVVMWSRHCYDWKPQPLDRLIARMASVAKHTSQTASGSGPHGSAGPILLLHDGDFRRQGGNRQHVVAALAHWLPRWRDAGLEFVTIDDVAYGT